MQTLKQFKNEEHGGVINRAAIALKIKREHCYRLLQKPENDVLVINGQIYQKMVRRK